MIGGVASVCAVRGRPRRRREPVPYGFVVCLFGFRHAKLNSIPIWLSFRAASFLPALGDHKPSRRETTFLPASPAAARAADASIGRLLAHRAVCLTGWYYDAAAGSQESPVVCFAAGRTTAFSDFIPGTGAVTTTLRRHRQ